MSETRPPLIPVLVDAAGRSGTTSLMQLLASSPAVATEREYPYESRYLTYLFSWSRLLDGCPDAAGRWERGNMLPGAPDELGGLPWRDLLPDPEGFASKCFLAAWRHFSAGVSDGCTHYIEKVPRWISKAVPVALPESRVVHLVRDPRDVWLSIRDFNAKRGYPAFGRRLGQDDESFFGEFVASQRARLEPLVGRVWGRGEMLLRFRQLVGAPAETASALGAWLGIELDPGSLRDVNDDHVTGGESGRPRWPGELDGEWQARFEASLGDLIVALEL